MQVVRTLASVLIASATWLLTACASTGAVPRPFPGAALPPVAAPSGEEPTLPGVATAPPPVAVPAAAPAVVRTALALRGTPYRNGGSDPGGFDCSGFVQWIFNEHGVRLPREVRDQFSVGRTVNLADVEAGDLLFFETVSRGASHVGIALGGGEFIHAPSSRGVVRIERYGADYWASRFVAARRIRVESAKAD
jgi:cell wall-associated NlpC family hydrolase